MAIIQTKKNDFQVNAKEYDFSFTAETLQGDFNYKRGKNTPVTFSFVPDINDIKLDNYNVAVKEIKEQSAAYLISDNKAEITLNLYFADNYFTYTFTLNKSESISKFSYQAIKGSFFQVHNYVPDLHSYDIPYRIKSPLTISSRKKEFSDFFQTDEGNYMMPAYLTALYDKEHFLGLGLLDIPDAVHPFNALIGADEFSLSFDYGQKPKSQGYKSPTFWVGVARCRQEVLSIYREAVDIRLSITKSREVKETDWWLEPIYTTWGDQVYTKHLNDGNLHLETGSDKYLNAQLVDDALNFLKEKKLNPKTIVLDEGWSPCLGYWDADDSKWQGSLKKYIQKKQEAGYKIVLTFNPFLVSKTQTIPGMPKVFVIKDKSGELKTVSSGGQDYYLFDWSNKELRKVLKEKLMYMFDQEGLNADGLKISETKLFPSYEDQVTEPGYGVGEKFLEAVFKDINSYVKEADDQAPIFLACLNPLFQQYFDIVRLGNISEVNHDLYVSRAEIASRLMPGKPIDMDDWACYQKVIGVTTYLKALCGIPNLYSSKYRGDGRVRFMGAMGGHPVETSEEQFNVLASAEALYQKSKTIARNELKIDFDSMTFLAGPYDKEHLRTYQGGNVLAVYKNKDIFFCSLLDSKVILQLPDNFRVVSINRILDDGSTEKTEYKPCFTNKILIHAKSSRFNRTSYYHIEGALNG